MSFNIVDIGGLNAALLLFKPQVRKDGSLVVAYAFATEVDMGDSGRETREADQPDVRLQQTCSYLLRTADEAAALRSRLSSLQFENTKIAMPIWVDCLKGSQWADRIHSSPFLVRIYDGGIVAADSALEANLEYAPLLIGRYKDDQPELQPWTDVGGLDTKIVIVDDSPWDYRVQINASVGPGTFPETLTPNWIGNIDRSENGRKFVTTGVGRESQVENQEMAFKWGQEASFLLRTRTEIRTLLATFVAQAGRKGAMTMPWWFKPAPDAPETPYSTKVRWASDQLQLEYNAGNVAKTTLAFWQLPWEINPPEDEEPEQAARAYLYRHTLKVPISPVVWRYTDYARPITIIEDGTPVTYFPFAIEHDKLTQGSMLDDDAVKLTSFVADNHPWMLLVKRQAEAPLGLEIFSCTPDLMLEPVELRYTGELGIPTGKGRKLSVPTTILAGLLDVQVPSFNAQALCNYDFCDQGCTLNIADFTCTATVTAISGPLIDLSILTNPAGHALDDDYFADGDCEWGGGLTWQGRDIIRSNDLGAGSQRLTLDREIRGLTVGSVLTLRPTCSKTREACVFFGNQDNFGGHWDIGEDNLSMPQREMDTAAGKK